MIEKTENVVKVPCITPELLQENEENQKKWRNLFTAPGVSLDKYTESVIKDNLATLDTLEAQLKTVQHANEPLEQKICEFRNDTAVWLASLGKFAEAEKLTIIPKQKTLYREYAEAAARADSEWCEHEHWTQNAGGQAEQNAYREFQFFSEIHGRKVSMMRCRQCGFRNARDISADLQKLSDFRAASRKLAENTPRENLANKLKSEGLHETDLSKIIKR